MLRVFMYFIATFLVGFAVGYTVAEYLLNQNDKLEELEMWLKFNEFETDDENLYRQGWNRMIDKTLRKIKFLKDRE